MPFVRSMASGKSHVALTTFLAGAMLLQPQTMAPQRDARVRLPDDALVRAVETHNELLFDLCVADGTNVNAAGADKRTPLLVALDQGQRETISRLLRMGASVDVADSAGRTPLMVAAAGDDTDLLRTFLAQSS
ncbi:MAG: ankyrin repeat domain-containing protein, partial [Verrucomicrobiota bacterium]|nr:ankyrin repeat domain-containing protein [Verrucomicrobiota bacterium]